MSVHALAQQYRNPDMPLLQQYAFEQGRALVRTSGVPGARFVLGGSLGYDAALVGGYDIDLRLLVPDGGKPREEVLRQIDTVKDLLAEQTVGDSTFKTRFIDEDGSNYIWHTRQTVKVPGIPGNPDVELSWNIQADSTYQGLAEIAARLPQEVKDRYVLAKWQARQKGGPEYKRVKTEWKSFLNLLVENGVREMDARALQTLLSSLEKCFPQFLSPEGDEQACARVRRTDASVRNYNNPRRDAGGEGDGKHGEHTGIHL